MNNKDDWKKIESDIQNKEYTSIQEYGIDINKRFNEITSEKSRSKRKIRFKILKYGVVLLIIFSIFFSIHSIKQNELKMIRINNIELISGNQVEEIPVKTKFNGDGLYSYQVKNEPNILIHAYFIKNKNKFESDTESRIYKYYFEKWQDSEKEKFIVEEKYEDAKCGLIYKKNWILRYRTIIEVTNYDEMISATKIIIRFIEYMGNRNVPINSYIKIGDNLIAPQTSNDLSNEEIMKSAIIQYNNIMQGTLKRPYK